MDPRLRQMLHILIAEYNFNTLEAAKQCTKALDEMKTQDISGSPELQDIHKRMTSMVEGLTKAQAVVKQALLYLKEEEDNESGKTQSTSSSE